MKARRKPLRYFLLTALAAAGFFLYLRVGVFPGKLKEAALAQIQALTGKRIFFEKTVYLPFRGLSFYNLQVMDSHGRRVFWARRLSLNARFIPFLRESKIILSNVELESPFLDFSLAPAGNPPRPASPPAVMTRISGQIPVPIVADARAVTYADLARGPDALLPENVYVEQINITDGVVRIRRKPAETPFEEIRAIELRMKLERPPLLDLEGSFKMGHKPYGRMAFRGKWDLDRAAYEFTTELKSMNVPPWSANAPAENFVNFKKGEFFARAHLRSQTETRAYFAAEADVKKALFSVGKASFGGELALEASGLYDFSKKRFEDYKGGVDFIDVQIDGLGPSMGRLSQVDGHVRFEPSLLTLSALEGHYRRLPFFATGSLEPLGEQNFTLNVRAHAALTEFLALLPPSQKRRPKEFTLEGPCDVEAAIKGSLKRTEALQVSGRLALANGALKNKKGDIRFEGINGQLQMEGQKGRLDLESPELLLRTAFVRQNETLMISDGLLRALGLSADFQGTAQIPDLVLDLKGNASLGLGAVEQALERRWPGTLKNAGLRGALNGRFLLKGLYDELLAWDLKMDGASDSLVIKEKFPLPDFQIQIRLKNGNLHLPYIHAKPYGGAAGARIFMDLSKSSLPFNAKLYVNHLDLARFQADLKLADADFSGSAYGQASLKGVLKSRETYLGEGEFDVKNGHLWKTDLFKQMGQLPFVRVEGLDEVTFHSLHGTFDVRGGRIWTDDLHLSSETVDLNFNGSMGFDQSLDLFMNIYYSGGVIEGGLETGGIVPYVLQKAEESITQYKITGTLKAPKSEKTLLPTVKEALASPPVARGRGG